MDWANEDYVRIYTRDTADLMAIGPEGRAVWWEILRKADKSGVIDHGGDLDTLPELLRVPHEWFENAIPKILKRKMAIDNGESLVIPNHEPAQTTPKSDKQRQKEARQKRRVASLAIVTERDESSQNVTKESRGVTNGDGIVIDGHAASRDVTLRYATQHNATQHNEVEAKPPSPHTEFIAQFTIWFEAARHCKPEWGQKQGANVKRLLSKPGGLNDALARARRMFDMADAGWPTTPDLGTLVACWDKFAPPADVKKPRDPTVGRVEPRDFDEYPDPDEDVTF